MNTTELHILGAGSMGLLLAAYLAPHYPVRLIRRAGQDYPPRLNVRLTAAPRQATVQLPQTRADRLPAPVRRLLVCTKAYDALPALHSLAPALEEASVLLLQNGMGSQEAIAEALPDVSVYAASSTEGAYRPEPGAVVHAGRGITRIGRLQGAEADWAVRFRHAGLQAEVAEPIAWHLANKLRVNALINPLTVLYRCRNGELLRNSAAYRELQALGEETDAILAAAGFRFEEPALQVAEQVARATAENYSSMYQDAQAGRRLELDYINGYLVRLAERQGLAAPVNAGVCERLQG
ncbi:hypothetical protein CAI21_21410 [Alkalilimnicola ehrlichii]|uniref:2-dehydropantoate 2-reductase n=1 Tax=Alkalilimnicola ehrlichii TaxID=351052 RepID=A0A3E0WIW4_9GAMM|nr:2-dehydropantoate 2-reductase [Alkalilimnicola ehrlichii]RFA24499.1 hypothetical protein CAI21_21410 [Alkalilimnicola ehrlichii]RFA32163.1 hypothetical protein CAL65_20290 [Alkalilimnicola ehrlichii]